jgi:carboxyl-terminal processing protease
VCRQLSTLIIRSTSCCVVAFAFLVQLTTAQASLDVPIEADERVFAASKMYSLLDAYSFERSGESVPQLDTWYRNYIHEIVGNQSRRQFDLATIEFVARLHSGHTFFWDASLDKDNEPLDFYAISLDGKWIIESSFRDDLRPGDVISDMDRVPLEEFYLQQRRYIAASSVEAQRRNLFLFPYLFPPRFTLSLEDGRRVVIDRASSKRSSLGTEGRWLKKGEIGYIRIPSFYHPRLEGDAVDYVRRFSRARVLIVDVRNNPGGIPPLILIRALMNRRYRGWLTCARQWPSLLDQDARSPTEVQSPPLSTSNANAVSSGDAKACRNARITEPSRNAYRGRLILLVNGGCVSACEDFVEPAKDSGRATLVGEMTQGSTGTPFVYDFHNGMSLRIAVTQNYFPDGSDFEGVGIRPDVKVHTTIEDLKNGRDPVLEKALGLAAQP